jgi:F0F1-type ATP synthase beta subunit
MDESPGVRFRVGMTALTYAEYLRDTLHKEVLLLMDNVVRHERFLDGGRWRLSKSAKRSSSALLGTWSLTKDANPDQIF